MFSEIIENISDMKILIVDDELNTLYLMSKILEDKFIIDTATKGSEVFDKLKSFKPDLILLDVMMPDMSGFEVCKLIKSKEEYVDLPIIIITAKTEDEDLAYGMSVGAIDYIRKPFGELELIARVENIIKVKVYIRKLKLLNQLKNSFISMVTHDIKIPLTSIIGFSELLLEEKISGPITPKQRKIVNQIFDSAMHQSRIIKDMLSLSILETGKINLDINDYPAVELYSDAYQEILFIAKTKELDIKVDIDGSLRVKCDKERIYQVFLNLLSNAVKFSFRKGEITIGAKKLKSYVEFYVKDNGAGIPKSAIDRIYDQYDLFTTKGTDGEKGTGLGLQICIRIIQEHSGSLRIESEEGKGACFYFTLPSAD